MQNGFILSAIILTTLFLLGTILAFITSVILVPIFFTPKNSLEKIIKKMELKDGEKLADLGSGDGRVLFAARREAKISAVGYEVSPIMVIISNFLKRMNFGLDRSITFEVASIFDVNLKQFDKIYCHLSPRAMEILAKKFERELGKGVYLYSWEHPLPKKKPLGISKMENGEKLYIYRY